MDFARSNKTLDPTNVKKVSKIRKKSQSVLIKLTGFFCMFRRHWAIKASMCDLLHNQVSATLLSKQLRNY